MRSRPRQPLGELLIAEGRIDPQQLERARHLQSLAGARLGTSLLEQGAIDEATLLDALGRQRSTQTVGADELRRIDPSIPKRIPAKLARRFRVVPFRLRGQTLLVASADGGDALREEEIGFLTSTMVRTLIGLEVRIEEALARYYGLPLADRLATLVRRLDAPAISPTASAAAVNAPSSALPSSSPPPAVPRTSASVLPPTSFAVPPAFEPASPRTGSAPSPTEHAAESSSSQPSPLPPAPPPPRSPSSPTEPKPEREFIELDLEDLGALRAPAAAPAALESGVDRWLAVRSGREPVDASASPARAEPAVPDATGFEGVEDPEGRLEVAARRLQDAEIRDEIADVILDFVGLWLPRRLLLVAKDGRLIGWEGAGLPSEIVVREIELATTEPSLFSGLASEDDGWNAPIPRLPGNASLIEQLGGHWPRHAIALPLVVRGRVVCHLYADDHADDLRSEAEATPGEDVPAGPMPMPLLRRLLRKAGVAFEVYILKNKIRVL
ncbi:MAG: hypothetical protein AAGN46_04525 [Acidobacteriota bacterium]